MESNVAAKHVGDLRDLVKRSRGIQISDLEEIRSTAEQLGGELVSVTALDGDDDICGNGRLRFKWPPRRGLGELIDLILNKGIAGDIIINGLPRVDEVLINFGRGQMR